MKRSGEGLAESSMFLTNRTDGDGAILQNLLKIFSIQEEQ